VRGQFLWLASVFGVASATAIVGLALVRLFGDVTSLLQDPRRVALVQAGMIPPSELPKWPMIVALGLLFVIVCTLLAWLIAARRRFGRRGTFAQWTLGLAGAAAPLLALGAMQVIILWGG
jgi:hypothetical protein